MKKNNYIIVILNIIFFIISLLSQTVLYNNNMIILVKPTILSCFIEIIFVLLVVFINIYSLRKNNSKIMRKLLIINIITVCINGFGMISILTTNKILSSVFMSFLSIVNFAMLILTVAIIHINKNDNVDYGNKLDTIFIIVLILEIILGIMTISIFINSGDFYEIHKQLRELDNEEYLYENIIKEKIEKFDEYEENGKYGIKNEKNKIIVNAEYEYVSKFSINDNIIYGYKDHHIDVYNVNGNKLGTFKDSIFFHYYKQYDSFSSEHRLTNN